MTVKPLKTLINFTFIGEFCFGGTYEALQTVLDMIPNVQQLRLQLLSHKLSATAGRNVKQEFRVTQGATHSDLWSELGRSLSFISFYMKHVVASGALQSVQILDWGANSDINQVIYDGIYSVMDRDTRWEHDGQGTWSRNAPAKKN